MNLLLLSAQNCKGSYGLAGLLYFYIRLIERSTDLPYRSAFLQLRFTVSQDRETQQVCIRGYVTAAVRCFLPFYLCFHPTFNDGQRCLYFFCRTERIRLHECEIQASAIGYSSCIYRTIMMNSICPMREPYQTLLHDE
jgi:hypothetical protein